MWPSVVSQKYIALFSSTHPHPNPPLTRVVRTGVKGGGQGGGPLDLFNIFVLQDTGWAFDNPLCTEAPLKAGRLIIDPKKQERS
jgi:hypothetical protein